MEIICNLINLWIDRFGFVFIKTFHLYFCVLVNAYRITHLNELNEAAYKKYEKIADATKAFREKLVPINEQCKNSAKICAEP